MTVDHLILALRMVEDKNQPVVIQDKNGYVEVGGIYNITKFFDYDPDTREDDSRLKSRHGVLIVGEKR